MEQDLMHEEDTIPWAESHLSVVYCYILKLGNISSEFKLLKSAKKLPFGEDLYPTLPFSREMVASFVQELQEVFIVPKVHQFSVQKKIELLAAFINFLLQLISHKTDLINSFEERIEVVNKELRFLVTVLRDTSLLLVAELEQIQKLLVEFDVVANEAGHLVYSFIFNIDRLFMAIGMDNALVALVNYIDHLKDNISNFSFLVQHISGGANIISKIGLVDSYFIADSLLHDLENLMNSENDQIVDVGGQIKLLYKGLRDMKLPQHFEIQGLKEMAMQIGNVAHEAEYLINSFLVGDAPLWYLIIRLPHVIHKIHLMGTELKEIKNNYESTGALEVAQNLNAQESKRNSEVDDITVGRQDEETHVRNQLVGGTKHLKVISIFGMPGIGKTTLARKLYSHPSVNYHFDRRSWCTVSQTYHMITILTDILMSLGDELDHENETLGDKIYKCLKGRRYLVVLDDIWSSNVWDVLLRYFPDDGNGSRVLFTSRYKGVAPNYSIIHALPLLSNDQCWKLLEKKVFHNKPCPPQLLQIGRKIAKNCQGLPLAVVVTAGILSTMDKEESAWEKLGGSLGSYIFSDRNNYVMQILKLSYNHLPHHLKHCFLYFGAFPEGKEIPVNKLTYLWVAEGFICREENKHTESVAEEYLMELINRSLVTVTERRLDGGAKSCVVHELLRDLCLRIAEEDNFLKWMGDNSIYTKQLRLCVHNMKPDPMAPHEYFLPFGHHIRSFFASIVESPEHHVVNMKLLRVLDLPINKLENYDDIEVPILVRYLAVNMTCLPTSIGRFSNLEFLIVNSMGDTLSIPPVIMKMMRLRYLHMTPRARFDKDCLDNPQTNNLQSFSTIEVFNQKDEDILKCSPHLRKLKCICGSFVDEQGTYRHPDLCFFTQLVSLKLVSFVTVFKLSSFHPHANGYGEPISGKINFPLNVKKLNLHGLHLPWEKMSIIGELPNLQILKLRHQAFVGERWETRDGEFQQLRILKIHQSPLIQWNVASSNHFPKLQQLILHNCVTLQEIPSEIGEITTLELIEVKSGGQSVQESAMKIQEEQREMGNEELRVIILWDTL